MTESGDMVFTGGDPGPRLRAIAHVDMDAFYAAIEQRDRPELLGQPVVVGGLGPRGVVATASYEARRFGVRSAMPTARARRLCPDGIYLSPRMAHYVSVSKEVFSVFRRVTPELEGLSLDEAFLDLGRSLALFGTPMEIGARIKAEVLLATGLRCSVGLASNKFLAKLASELSKPDGLRALAPENVQETLDPLPVGRLWTVGPVAEARLQAAGIQTVAQMRSVGDVRLRAVLGAHGLALGRLARGEDDRPVQPNQTERSLAAEETVDIDLATLADALALLMRLVERVAERARAHALVARVVTLKLRVPPFETSTRRALLEPPTHATDRLHAAASTLLGRWWTQAPVPRLRLLGVSLSELAPDSGPAAGDLFEPPAAGGRDTLVDRINQRFGSGAIRRARGVRDRGSP